MESHTVIQDIHICGACRSEFTDIYKFIEHKKACYLSNSGGQAAPVLVGANQVTQHSNTVDRDSQLTNSHESFLYSSSASADHVETQELMSSSVSLNVSSSQSGNNQLMHPDEAYTSSTSFTSQHKSSDISTPYTYSWPSEPGINCSTLTVDTDHKAVEKNMTSQKVETVGQRDSAEVSADSIAVYVVSPKSFASSMVSQEKCSTGTVNTHADINSAPALWAHSLSTEQTQQSEKKSVEILPVGQPWKVAAACTEQGAGHEITRQVNDILQLPNSQLAKLQLTSSSSCSFYTESELTPNSDNSTPCPEDLEVGEISAAMLEHSNQQDNVRAILGDGNVPTSNTTSLESTAGYHNPAGMSLASTVDEVDGKVLISDMSIVSEYIRENTASAPLMKSKGCRGGQSKKRITAEKRERLQGVSDELLTFSPQLDVADKNNTCITQSTGGSLPLHTAGLISVSLASSLSSVKTSSMTGAALTSYKAIFTSPSSAGHRLTPTQRAGPDSDVLGLESAYLPHGSGQTFSRNSDTLSGQKVVYKNISASVKRQNENKSSQVKSKSRENAVSGSARSKTERQIIFDTQDQPVTIDPVKCSQIMLQNSNLLTNLQQLSSSQTCVVLSESCSSGSSVKTETECAHRLMSLQETGVDMISDKTNLENTTLCHNAVNQVRSSLATTHGTINRVMLAQPSSQAQSKLQSQMHLKSEDNVNLSNTTVIGEADGSNSMIIYKNSDGSFLVMPKCTTKDKMDFETSSLDVPLPDVLQACHSETGPTRVPDSMTTQLIKQTFQLSHQQNIDSSVTVDVTDTSDESESVSQQQYYIHSLPLNDTSGHSSSPAVSSPATTINTNTSQLFPHSAGVIISLPSPNRVSTIHHGTGIPTSNFSSEFNQNAVAVFSNTSHNTSGSIRGSSAQMKPQTVTANRVELPPVEREKYIIKPRKTATQTSVAAAVARLKTSSAQKNKVTPSLHVTPATEVPETNLTADDNDGKRSFVCKFDKCSYTTNLYKDFQRHYRRHTGERPYQCQVCAKTFNRSDKLKIHTRQHTGSKPFQCQLCSYAATEGGSLKKHMRIHNDERPFKCQICSYASRNSSQLIVHLRTHTGDTPFHCTKCAAKFKINSDLKRHMRVHTGEKPFHCDKCDYKSSNKGNLTTHIRINHSKDNEIRCQKCPFVTSSSKMLRDHMKMHDTNVVKCPKCEYTCTSINALRSHAAIHNSVKPYRCTFCPYSSKQSGNLKKHMQNVHTDKLRSIRHRMSSSIGGNTSSHTKTNRENVLLPFGERTGNGRRRGNVSSYRKLHTCKECGHSFVREDSLRCHMKQHDAQLGAKPSRAEQRKNPKPQRSYKDHQHSPTNNSAVTSPSYTQPGLPHIFAAASKMYEEHYCTEATKNKSSTSQSLADNAVTTSTEPVASWSSSSALMSSSDYSDTDGNVDSSTSTHSQSFNDRTTTDGYINATSASHHNKTMRNVPWEHRSYTLSIPSDDETSDPSLSSRVLSPLALAAKSPLLSPKSSIFPAKSIKAHHKSAPRKPVIQQQHFPNPLKRRRVEKSFTSPATTHTLTKTFQVPQANFSQPHHQQQQQLQSLTLQPQVFVQHSAAATAATATSKANIVADMTGAANTESTFILTHQGMSSSVLEPSYNIQLVPQVSSLAQGSSQVATMTQELLQQLSVQATPQLQFQPATHIQIVLPGSTTIPAPPQIMGGTAQATIPQQQIVLQVQNAGGHSELITIPVGHIGNFVSTQSANQSLAQFPSHLSSHPVTLLDNKVSEEVPLQMLSHYMMQQSGGQTDSLVVDKTVGQTLSQIIPQSSTHAGLQVNVPNQGLARLQAVDQTSECVVVTEVCDQLES